MPTKRQFIILPGAQLNLEKEGVGIPCPLSGKKVRDVLFVPRSKQWEQKTCSRGNTLQMQISSANWPLYMSK